MAYRSRPIATNAGYAPVSGLRKKRGKASPFSTLSVAYIPVLLCAALLITSALPIGSITALGGNAGFSYISFFLQLLASSLTIPVTLLSMFISGRWRFGPKEIKHLLPPVLFIAFLLVQLLVAPDSAPITFRFGIFGAGMLTVIPFLALRDPQKFEWLRNVLAALGAFFILGITVSNVWGNIASATGSSAAVADDRVAFGVDTISAAFYCYVEAIACVCLWQSGWGPRWVRNGALFVAFGLSMAALLTGSKGPLVGFVLALIILFLIGKMSLKTRVLSIGSCVAIGMWEFLRIQSLNPASYQHLAEGADDPGRQYLYASVLHSPPSLFGSGASSFTINTGEIYPHNVLLELYYEMGLFGTILYLTVIVTAFFSLYKRWRKYSEPGVLFLICVLTQGTLFGMFSGSIYGQKVLFAMLISGALLCSAPPYIPTREAGPAKPTPSAA